MRRIRFSMRFLVTSLSVIAALCAFPAWYVTAVRREAAAGNFLESVAAYDADGKASASHSAVSYQQPRGRVRRWLYYLEHSPGEVTGITILGDASAQAVTSVAHSLPNVKLVNVTPAAMPGKRGLLTQSQIDAVGTFGSIDWLQIYGRFGPYLDFSNWSRIKRVNRVEIDSDAMPSGLIQQLGRLNVDWLTIYCDYNDENESLDKRLPSEAFATFAISSCSNITICGDLDDRALELISRAPRLEQLVLLCPGRIGRSSWITEAGIGRACRNMHVRRLEIGGDYMITEATIDHLASIGELRSFNLVMTPAARARLFALRPDLK